MLSYSLYLVSTYLFLMWTFLDGFLAATGIYRWYPVSSLFPHTVLVAYGIFDGSLPSGSAFLETYLISGDS
jgi:hypothetical protein